jgi:hypothetical protein
MLTNFNEPGDILVRVVRGDEYIRLGRLRVLQHPNFIQPVAEKKEAAN